MSNEQSHKNVTVPAAGGLPSTEVDVNAVLAEAQKTGNLAEAKFFALLNVLMAKEARLAEKEAMLESSLKARDEQRKRESENYTIAIIENQKSCKHLKGGKTRSRRQQIDYNVFLHTFTDGTPVIKCHNCKARWFQQDTAEYLQRNGMSIPNWTRIGWREAAEMLEDSSNKMSTSERFNYSKPTASAPRNEKGALVPNLQL